VTNRGNERRRIFHEDVDYERFLHLLARGKSLYPVKLYGVCLMPNHFHAVVQPLSDGALSAYFQWVLGRYACDLRSLTGTVGYGHVFQSRFWNDPILDERHFLSVLRYTEANPVRACLVERAESWPWSSLTLRSMAAQPLLDPLPLSLPQEWSRLVNEPQPPLELDILRNPEVRGRPTVAKRRISVIAPE
jgi:putative transposase